MKHTKGKWHYKMFGQARLNCNCVISSDNDDTICVMKRDDNADRETQEANAKLITAAPDLLGACNKFIELFNNSDMRPEDEAHELAAIVKSAIKKATE